MKTIYVVRHAKSSWDFPQLSDHERPLISKGIKRTKLISEYLVKNNITVDLVVASHATRALETAKLISRAIGYPSDNIRIERMIYHADADQIFDQFYDIPDGVDSIMIVGHNPTFTNFANLFLSEKVDWLPTSGLVCINFDTDDWLKLPEASSSVKFMITPRMLKEKKRQS